jgi:hypothetical protein
MFAAAAMPALAQDHPLADRAKNEVIQFLALTPDQVTTWDGLIATHQQTVPPLRTQLQAVEDQIKAALAQPNPDPAAVGALVIQGKGVRDQIQAANTAYESGFEGMLATDQLAKLVFLRKADKAEPLFPAFRFYRLIPRFDHDWWLLPAEP